MQTFLDGGAQRFESETDSGAAGGDRMKQVLQHARTGEIALRSSRRHNFFPVVCWYACGVAGFGGHRARSSGFASKNLLQKAKARPDLVRDVIA